MKPTWSRSLPTYLHGGVLHAIREIRHYRRIFPEATIRDAAKARSSVSSDIGSYDYETAIGLLSGDRELEISEDVTLAGIARDVLAYVISSEMPPWAELIPYGRRPVIESTRKKESNVYQCFDYGDLFGEDDDTFGWWERMEHRVRDRWQQAKDETGITAERLSLDYERCRIELLGRTDLRPVWESREDTRLGYDIQSWDVATEPARKTYIEVKGCRRPPLSLYLTPNEWKVALAKRASWFIHLWDLSNTDRPYIITVDDLELHIPTNKGSGQWKSSQIAWPFKRGTLKA